MSRFGSFGRRSGYVLSVAIITMMLGSCDLAKNQLTYDRPTEKDRQDYRDIMAPNKLPPENPADMPDFESVISTPAELKLPSPLVTVSVNQTVSLRDLMFELAEQAEVDLELDPQIHGSLIFTAKERPFDEVISRICEMTGLRYTFKSNVLRVELDRPYLKSYPLSFVDAGRTGTASISTSTSMGAAGGGDTGNGTTTGGSSASLNSTFSGDLWKELEENIEQILTSSDTYISLATLADPAPSAVNTMPPPPVSTDPNNPTPPPLPGQAGQMPAAMAPTLSVNAVRGETLVPSPPATYSMSKQSGTLTIFASDRQQRLVEKYLKEFIRRTTTQVVIEAKVLQVDLNDEYATGIDWAKMNLTGMANFDISGISPGVASQTASGITGVLSVADVNLAVQAVSEFGTVRALSSPRVTVLNNQQALVNVSENNIYFTFDVESTEATTTTGRSINVDSEIESAPEGVVLSVVPSANPDTGEVIMIVRPTISRIASSVDDPTVGLSLVSIGVDPTTSGIPKNAIPQVSVQEIDSILRLQSGQIAMMGGLMKDSNNVTQAGVPVLGDIPYLGSLFKSHVDKVNKSELVIFIKATIAPGANIDDMDRKLYNTMGNDRRPSRM